MQQLLGSDAPGVAALMLHRLQQQADKCWANTSGKSKHPAGQLKMHAQSCGLTLLQASNKTWVACTYIHLALT